MAPAAVFAAWRAYIIMNFTGEGTGFLPRSSTVGLMYMVPLVLFCAWLYLAAWKKAPMVDTLCNSTMMAGADVAAGMTICAVGLIVCAWLSFQSSYRGSMVVVVMAVIGAVCAIMMIPASGGKRTAKAGYDSYMALGLVAWGIAALLGIFLANNTITQVPENMLSMLTMAALLAGLFNGARLRAGIATAGKFLSSMAPAALLATATEIPSVALRFLGHESKFVSNSMPINIAVLFMLPMMWATLFAVERKTTGRKKRWTPPPLTENAK